MAVYFKNKNALVTETPNVKPLPQTIQAHEKIGETFSRASAILKSNNPNQIDPLLKDLGVDPNDIAAATEMRSLLTQLDDNTLQVSPLVSGVFLLKKKNPENPTKDKEVAVFKVGRKRAAMETSARYMANLLGLGKHVLSGMYCAMLNLPLYELVDEENTTEDLWNGNQKVYQENKPIPTPTKQPAQALYNPMLQFELEWDADEQNTTQNNSSDFTKSADEDPSKSSSSVTKSSEDEKTKTGSSDFTRTEEEEPSQNLSLRVTKSSKDEKFKTRSSDFTRINEGALSQNYSSEVTHSSEEGAPKQIGSARPEKALNSKEWDTEDDELSLSVNEEVFSTACAVVGIVQPFLFDTEEADVYEFTLMTVAALAIGLRDGKHDGFKGSTLFDVEDNFPIRIDPLYVKGQMRSSCTVDLLYLDNDDRTQQHLTLEQVYQLHQLVSKWDLLDIIKKLEKMPILYMDTVSETMDVDVQGKDEGNFEILVTEGVEHAINGTLNALENNPKRRILNREQINAVNTRLSRIRDFITKCALEKMTFCVEDLVDAVDIAGKVYKDKLQAESETIPLSTQSVLKRSGPHHVTGRVSPETAKLQITEKEILKKSRGALQPIESRDESLGSSSHHPLNTELGIAISPVNQTVFGSDEEFGNAMNQTFFSGDGLENIEFDEFGQSISPIVNPFGLSFSSDDAENNENNPPFGD